MTILNKIEALQNQTRTDVTPKLARALPELWAIWCSISEGPRLHAEGRLAAWDVGIGYKGASEIGSALSRWRDDKRTFEGPERLNDALLALFQIEVPAAYSPLKRAILEMQATKWSEAAAGREDLHHKRIHAVSRRLRDAREEEGADRQVLIETIAVLAGVPSWAVSRMMVGSEKVITQHIERVERALRELEAAHV